MKKDVPKAAVPVFYYTVIVSWKSMKWFVCLPYFSTIISIQYKEWLISFVKSNLESIKKWELNSKQLYFITSWPTLYYILFQIFTLDSSSYCILRIYVDKRDQYEWVPFLWSLSFFICLQAAIESYLKSLQRADFDVFNGSLQQRNHWLPLLLWLNKVRKRY